MMNILRILVTLIGISLFLSCEKDNAPENVICENAQLDLCNPTSDQIVVYSWNTNQATDTLFPGECKIENFGPIKIIYNKDGSVKEKSAGISHYYTDNGSRLIEILDCYIRMDAPTGYINISHCYNGVFDPQEGELDTDCGGNCLPCQDFHIPCDTMKADRLKWSDQTTLLWLSSTHSDNYYDGKKTIEFTFYDGEVLYLSLPGNDLPTKDERLMIGDGFQHAKMWFTDYYGMNRREAVDSSSVYFLLDSMGKETVQFCDVDFKYSNGNTVKASANLVVD